MYIERVPNRNSPPAVLVRESYREGSRIRKRTLANLSKLPDSVVDNLKIVLKGGAAIENLSESFSVVRSLPHGHVAAVLGTLKKLDLHNLITAGNSRKRALVLAMIVARILDPRSKLATARGLNSETCFSSLSELLGLEKADEDELYEAMDWLTSRQESIENELANRHLTEGALVLYDVSFATQRGKRSLKGADQIGLRVGRVLNSRGVGKYFNISITDESFSYSRNESAIISDAALDGVYIIRTSISAQTLDTASTVRAYKSLSQVEQAFRSYKTIDLKVRPIYHRLEQRVKAHIFLCMLAYYVEWHMRKALAPILFDDEKVTVEPEEKSSVVAPSKRSKQARAKAATKKTSEKLPVHSFRTLMTDLATIVKNKFQSNGLEASLRFEKITQPTPLQQKALDLLEVSLICTQ